MRKKERIGNKSFMSTKILIEIDKIIEETEPLEKILNRSSEEHVRWFSHTMSFLRAYFGKDSEELRAFTSLSWVQDEQAIIGGPTRPDESWNPQLGIDRVNKEAYKRHLKTARGILLAIKDDTERRNADCKEKMIAFYSEVKEVMGLCEQGILSTNELEVTKKKAESLFDEVFALDQGATVYRKFRAIRNGGDWIYREQPRAGSGGFVDKNNLGALGKLESLIKEFVSLNEEEAEADDVLISKGELFSARKVLRGIIEKASSKIVIIDSYLDPSILVIIEPHVSVNGNVEVQLLTTDKNPTKLKALLSDLEQFKKQYPLIKIELRVASSMAHDRYILLDEDIAFHSGHSLGDLGNATSRISKMTKKSGILKIIEEFNTDWTNATVI